MKRYDIVENEDISAFTKIAGTYDVLKPDKEKELIYRTQVNQEKHARELLIKHNYKLVIDIAKRYRGKGLDFAELIQEGLCGLDKGIDKFDPSKGFKLSTYATWWIKQSIQRALDNTSRTIRIPIHILNEYRLVKRAYREHCEVEESPPTAEVLCEMTKEIALVKKKAIKINCAEDVEIIGRMFHPVSSLDTAHTEDENLTWLDYLASSDDPEQSVEDNNNLKLLFKMLDKLEPVERNLIVSLWGLVGKARTVKRMAAYRRISEEALIDEVWRILDKLATFAGRSTLNLDWTSAQVNGERVRIPIQEILPAPANAVPSSSKRTRPQAKPVPSVDPSEENTDKT